MDINNMTARQFQQSFYYDEASSAYVSDRLRMTISPSTRYENEWSIHYSGHEVPVHRTRGRKSIIIDRSVLDLFTVVLLVTTKDNESIEHLLDYRLCELETYSDYAQLDHFNPLVTFLKHQNMDVYDAVNDVQHLNINRNKARGIVGCDVPTLWGLAHPKYSGIIEYSGFYVRHHQEGEFKIEGYDANDIFAPNQGDDMGIFLMVHENHKQGDKVYAFNSMHGIHSWLDEEFNYGENPVIAELLWDELLHYIKDVNTPTMSSIRGYKIRRVDQINGVNIRFSNITIG